MSDGSNRVYRGGGWNYGSLSARVAHRYSGGPGERGSALGIRLVEVIDDPAPAATTSRSAPAAATSAPGSWNPPTIKDSPGRVSRGGGWINDPQYARVARGGCDAPGSRYSDVGIRLVEVTGKSSCVFRGSCSGSELEFARVTNGNFVGPGFRSETIGIRLVEVTDD